MKLFDIISLFLSLTFLLYNNEMQLHSNIGQKRANVMMVRQHSVFMIKIHRKNHMAFQSWYNLPFSAQRRKFTK